ncbi:MAG: PorV/PorQ family protein, partial [Calditrichaeota bacterium]|nr:PorV/PorQ family protein [Calditrichota bacterium]
MINRFNTVKYFGVVLIAFIMLAPSNLFAQAKVGTAGVQFLKVGVGTRAVGMGEAFTAVADDASALYYNPGGLIQLTMPEATFTLIDYPAGLKFVFIGGVVPMPLMSGVVGVQVTSLFTDDMIETTPEMPYGTGRSFTASDLALGMSYCQRLTDKFSVGGSFKYLNERLADVSANGWSVDVGTFYTTGWKKINIGMVIQHFGPDMDFENSPFPLPMT